jgi:hypothetical protein
VSVSPAESLAEMESGLMAVPDTLFWVAGVVIETVATFQVREIEPVEPAPPEPPAPPPAE